MIGSFTVNPLQVWYFSYLKQGTAEVVLIYDSEKVNQMFLSCRQQRSTDSQG